MTEKKESTEEPVLDRQVKICPLMSGSVVLADYDTGLHRSNCLRGQCRKVASCFAEEIAALRKTGMDKRARVLEQELADILDGKE